MTTRDTMTPFFTTVRRQDLGAELRAMRKAAGYTLEDAAKVINYSTSLLSRIETGHRSVSPVDVSALIGAYHADPKKRDQLIALAEESGELGWWQRNLADHAQRMHTLITLESKAESIVTFDLAVVPGLLQTAEYARAVMAECGYVPETEIEDRTIARLHRQSLLLRRDPPTLLAIIDECALRRLVGGREVLRYQLQRLVQESSRPQVSLRVVPNDGRAHSGIDGSFVLLRRTGLAPVVYTDNLTSSLFMEENHEVDMYELVLQHLLNRALDEEESVSLVANLASRLDMEANNGWDQPTYPSSPGERAATAPETRHA